MGSFVSPTSFWKPDYIEESAWLEHAPFAFWLVDALRPSTFVELGTHGGLSYLSLCQAVARLGIPANGFAIDTWRGDEHTGFYGEEVFTELVAYHDPRYSSFSRLVRSTFDDALAGFEDNSVDLLHLDGLHTYEAVHHDYATWRPKLSPRCVVIFHDTNVRERDFGVHRLWAELRAEHPAFEFVHGHGLGVLGLGTDLPSRVRQLLDAEASPVLAAEIRQVYAHLGAAVRLEFEASAREAEVAALEAKLATLDEKLRTRSAELEMRDEELAALSADDAANRYRAEALEHDLSVVLSSESWRVTAPLRHIGRRVRKFVATPRTAPDTADIGVTGAALTQARHLLIRHMKPHVPLRARAYLRRRFPHAVQAIARAAHGQRISYAEWIDAFDTLDDADRAAIRLDIATLEHRPLISVLMPVFNTPEAWLRQAIESVRLQLYEHWELCICDDASTAPHVREVLDEFRRVDPRIKVTFHATNGHISAASNSALALAEGDYVALLDHDDELAEYALYFVAREIDCYPDASVIYSDEDKMDERGHRFDPYFKPEWSPDLLRSQNYISHLGVYKTSLLRELGGFREGFEGSQDYDLVLRAIECVPETQIRHIPHVLYHWRAIPGSAANDAFEKTYALEAAQRAVTEHLQRTRRKGTVQFASVGGFQRVRYQLPRRPPLVSIVVPTRDGRLLERCIDSLIERTTYQPYELVFVDNGSRDPRTLAYLEALAATRSAQLLRDSRPFNHSALTNLGARHAHGELLCLLNDDVEVITESWLEELVSHALRDEIGAVGARLLYPDGRVQHAGVILGVRGVAGHAFRLLDGEADGPFGRASLIHNYSAVTAACLVVRRSLYKKVGGLDQERLPTHFNDVDFCLRLIQAGYRNLWTPYAQLYHHESLSRKRPEEDTAQFLKAFYFMRTRWGELLQRDPAYNPNLTLDEEDLALAWPPRIAPPWEGGTASYDELSDGRFSLRLHGLSPVAASRAPPPHRYERVDRDTLGRSRRNS